MSDAKHSSGPWTAERKLFTRAAGWDIFAGGNWVCRLYEETDDREEWKANARLIAAAPDMLTALRKVAQAIDGYGCISAAQGIEKEVLAVIAKATGGSE